MEFDLVEPVAVRFADPPWDRMVINGSDLPLLYLTDHADGLEDLKNGFGLFFTFLGSCSIIYGLISLADQGTSTEQDLRALGTGVAAMGIAVLIKLIPEKRHR